MNVHSVLCIRQPAFRDMIVGEVYNYTVGELVVEFVPQGDVACFNTQYWLAGEGFPVKAHMPIYAWASAVHVGDIVPVNDLPPEED